MACPGQLNPVRHPRGPPCTLVTPDRHGSSSARCQLRVQPPGNLFCNSWKFRPSRCRGTGKGEADLHQTSQQDPSKRDQDQGQGPPLAASPLSWALLGAKAWAEAQPWEGGRAPRCNPRLHVPELSSGDSVARTAPKRVALGFLDDPRGWLCGVPRLAQANRWFMLGVLMGHWVCNGHVNICGVFAGEHGASLHHPGWVTYLCSCMDTDARERRPTVASAGEDTLRSPRERQAAPPETLGFN